MLTIYVNSVCINEGQPRAAAGAAAYFGISDMRNYKGKQSSNAPQTRMRALLEAIFHAIKRLRIIRACDDMTKHKEAVIKTESQEAISYIQAAQCQKNGTPSNAVCYPPDCVDILVDILKELGRSEFQVSFERLDSDTCHIFLLKAHQMAISMTSK